MEQTKPTGRLSSLSMDRLAPRRQTDSAPLPEAAEAAPERRSYRQPSRARTTMIAGHFDADVSLALRELVARVGREQGKRVTVQDALTEALRLYFEKHGATPPEALSV